MIIYDTTFYKEPCLTKFEGGMAELQARHGTYKSFEKAKKIVRRELLSKLKEIKNEIDELDAISSPNDLDFVPNPYTGYLKARG